MMSTGYSLSACAFAFCCKYKKNILTFDSHRLLTPVAGKRMNSRGGNTILLTGLVYGCK